MSPSQFLLLTYALASAIVLIAAFVQSLTGFGFALVSVPILILLLEPKAVVPTSLILGGVLNLMALRKGDPNAATTINWSLLIGSLAGVPLGAWLLQVLNPLNLRLLVALTGLMFGTALLLNRTWQFRQPRLASAAIGMISGALNGSTSMGGAPVALFLANQGSDKDGFRTNLLLYILLVNAVALISFIPIGMLTQSVLGLSLVLVPAMLSGFVLGNWLFPRLSALLFGRIVIAVVVATSAAGMLMAVAEYFRVVNILR